MRERRTGADIRPVISKSPVPSQTVSGATPYDESRSEGLDLSNDDWQVHTGLVVMSLPQYGYHVVAINSFDEVRVAQSAGVNDVWGAHSVRNAQIGSTVLVATHPLVEEAVILGNTASKVTFPTDEFLQPSFATGFAGVKADPLSKEYVEKTDKDIRLTAYNTTPLWDQNAGDWGVRFDTGISVLVDQFSAQIFADEITGLWVDLLDQRAELSGRVINIQSDGVVLRNARRGDVSILALGRSAYRSENVRIVDKSGDDSYQQNLCDWVVTDESTPGAEDGLIDPAFSLGHAFQTVVVGPGFVGSTHYGAAWMEASPRGIRAISGRMSGLFSSIPAYYEFIDEAPVPKNAEQFEPKAVKAGKTKQGLGELPEVLYPGAAIASALADAYAEPQVFVGLMGDAIHYRIQDNEDWLGPVSEEDQEGFDDLSVSEAIEKHEAYTVRRRMPKDGRKPYWQPVIKGASHNMAGVFVDEETGDVAIFNEQGAGIRLSGSSVFIEGLQIRLSAVRDVVLLGRDVNLLANRDVTLTSDVTTRIYSNRNVNILGGNSGRGGVFIESRSLSGKVDLKGDPAEDLMSGVIVKSKRSPIVLLGGDIIAKAGDKRVGSHGDILLLAERGRVIESGSHGLIHNAQHRITQTFNDKWWSPTPANTFTSNRVVLSGVLYARRAIIQRSIEAGSHIQTLGRLAQNDDSGRVGKIRDELKEKFRRWIEDYVNEINNPADGKIAENLFAIKQEHDVENGLLSSQTYRQLSSGFRLLKDGKNPYGTQTVQSTYSHELRSAYVGVPQKPFQFVSVEYMPDVSAEAGGSQDTDSWPGTGAKVYRAWDGSGENRIGQLISDWSNGVSTAVGGSVKETKRPDEVFFTVNDT